MNISVDKFDFPKWERW